MIGRSPRPGLPTRRACAAALLLLLVPGVAAARSGASWRIATHRRVEAPSFAGGRLAWAEAQGLNGYLLYMAPLGERPRLVATIPSRTHVGRHGFRGISLASWPGGLVYAYWRSVCDAACAATPGQVPDAAVRIVEQPFDGAARTLFSARCGPGAPSRRRFAQPRVAVSGATLIAVHGGCASGSQAIVASALDGRSAHVLPVRIDAGAELPVAGRFLAVPAFPGDPTGTSGTATLLDLRTRRPLLKRTINFRSSYAPTSGGALLLGTGTTYRRWRVTTASARRPRSRVVVPEVHALAIGLFAAAGRIAVVRGFRFDRPAAVDLLDRTGRLLAERLIDGSSSVFGFDGRRIAYLTPTRAALPFNHRPGQVVDELEVRCLRDC